MGALDGIKVLDLTQAMSGPFATMILGDLGAEIIKVEPPEGDQTRSWAPPYMGGISSYFMSTNRNKKSISIDLKKPDGKEILRRLIKTSDVLVENFRPGVMEKLGFSREEAMKLNGKLIYCSISGFGQTGPMKDLPGYDLVILAISGLLGITGNPGSPPVKFGVPIADITTALFAAISVLAALYSRKDTGRGQYIDLSMLDSNFLVLTHQLTAYLSTGKNPEKLGSAHSSIAPYQAFSTRDGYIVITVGTEKLWEKFCNVLDPSLITVPEFRTNVDRVGHRAMLESKINELLENRTTADIYKTLSEAGIPCAPVNRVSDAVNYDQIKFRKMILNMHTDNGNITIPGTPLKLSDTPGTIRLPPPWLGNKNEEILAGAGYTMEEVQKLYAKNIIFKRMTDNS
ncbi:MAG: CaiB/BaiF CoA-transferase family protein [Ferroplasma sp.]|uniref:CaiB/BaiF CoA transferase family protein n=1 Tax=Ferroplasma sp. TaxID=2591003 RepID=UPI002815C11B|nr:CaiB/BaiF CoA-transferase family protein [Ferroplasma sp.]WMT50696.1 MAG: CaiB/BaiF CoA-transferase family protein [Ferroplasma sp.]